MICTIVVAVSDNLVIGNNNDLIWHLPRDLQFFKKTTIGGTLLMGRKTFEALGKPLPKRKHLVISRNFTFEHPDVLVFQNVESALTYCKSINLDEVFVTGGGEIYKQFLVNNMAQRAIITKIHGSFTGDTSFLGFNENEWKLVSKVDYDIDDKNNYAMSFCFYSKL